MTIKDIARASGYAVSTVSRALNNHPDVSEKAKKRIRQVVSDMGFVPNNNARQLKQQQSSSIVIIVKGCFNMFFASIIVRMQLKISEAKFNAVVHYIEEEQDEVQTALQLLRERKPLGIIFLGGSESSFKAAFSGIQVPCVLSTTRLLDTQYNNLSSVGIDDVFAAKEAVDYLYKNGHTKIGIIGGDTGLSSMSALRREGCKMSFLEHGESPGAMRYEKASYSYSGAYRAMLRLLKSDSDITAVFCMSDIMALGAIRAIADSGLSVPGDISVMGFDGIELSDYSSPRIATIRQPQCRLADESVSLLLSQITAAAPARAVTVGVQLIEGESVRRLE